MAVIIFGFWNVPVVRNVINPLKLFTIGWHELCHISAVSMPPSFSCLVMTTTPQAILTGGRILKITIDPHVGGATIVEGGVPGFVLSSGYIGSTLLGGAFVLAGWDTLVAKVLSFVLGVGLVLPLVLVRDKLCVVSIFCPCRNFIVICGDFFRTILLTLCYEGMLVGFWFIDHG